MKKHIRKMIGFKYPKLIVFALFILAAYIIFQNEQVINYFSRMDDGNLSMFIAGVLFAFGFTSPFAVGIFLVSNPNNIIVASILGGIGSVFANMLVFNLIKSSFTKELEELEKTKIVRGVEHAFEFTLPKRVTHYLLYVFAGVIIASPLPDEIAVSMFAGLTHIKKEIFIILSFILHTAGIYLILTI